MRLEQKKRKLDPIIDTIDLSATFNFSTVNLSRLEDKYFKWKRGGSLGSDPRQLPATQRHGFFELQTRFDKYGRVIEPWEVKKYKFLFLCILGIFSPRPPSVKVSKHFCYRSTSIDGSVRFLPNLFFFTFLQNIGKILYLLLFVLSV